MWNGWVWELVIASGEGRGELIIKNFGGRVASVLWRLWSECLQIRKMYQNSAVWQNWLRCWLNWRSIGARAFEFARQIRCFHRSSFIVWVYGEQSRNRWPLTSLREWYDSARHLTGWHVYRWLLYGRLYLSSKLHCKNTRWAGYRPPCHLTSGVRGIGTLMILIGRFVLILYFWWQMKSRLFHILVRTSAPVRSKLSKF